MKRFQCHNIFWDSTGLERNREVPPRYQKVPRRHHRGTFWFHMVSKKSPHGISELDFPQPQQSRGIPQHRAANRKSPRWDRSFGPRSQLQIRARETRHRPCFLSKYLGAEQHNDLGRLRHSASGQWPVSTSASRKHVAAPITPVWLSAN